MRYANLIFGILLSAAAASGCNSFYQQSESLITGKPVSAFLHKGAVPINRETLDSLVRILHQEGYDRGEISANIDDEEYFDSLKASLRQQYDQEWRLADASCDSVYEQTLLRSFGQFMPHSKAGRAKDACLYSQGWQAGTQRMYDQIINLAWQKVARDAQSIASTTAPKESNVAERVFESTWRSVVFIKSGGKQGSGVVIRPNIVATNCHVVDSGRVVVYKTGNRRALTDSSFAATIRRRDTARDFCLLNVAGLWGIPTNIRAYNTLKVGEDVYALGAPQGLDLSLSSGVISQLRQDGGRRGIQTDTAISPGSSGGGLFDSDGNLVGITTAKQRGENVEGINWAIPADLAAGL